MDPAPNGHTPEPQRERGWRGRLIPAGLLVVAIVLVVLVAMMPGEPPPTPQQEVRAVNVEVLRIQAVPMLADTFDLTAVIEPERVVRVAAEVAGRIERIAERSRPSGGERASDPTKTQRNSGAGDDPQPTDDANSDRPLQEGDPVVQGVPIIDLNTDLLRAAYERAKAQFDFDQREYQRILGLYERDASARSELDDARAKRDISRAMLDEAAAQLSRAVVVAPIDGILNRLPMEVGEYASPGDCVAEIVDVSRVKVVVDVPERDVYRLSVGDPAEILVRTPQPATVTGRITYISELADEQTRTTRTEITVQNPDHRLRSGQITRARLTRQTLTDVIMIPLDTVIPLEHGKAVYVVDENNCAQHREIELGLIKGRSVQVLGGLTAGDRLIVAGHRYVGSGQPVTIVEER